MNFKRIMLPLLVVLLVVGAGLGGWFYYQGTLYVTTSDARVDGHLVAVVPQATGKLLSLDARVGQEVHTGQVVAVEELSGGGAQADIYAPVAGTVATIPGVVGQMVAPGETVLTLVNLRHLWIQGDFKETLISEVHPGQRALISVDALGGRVLHGTVQYVQPATQSVFSLLPPIQTSGNYIPVTQRVPVHIRLDTMPPVLVPGMSATVRLERG
ncbi:MAG: efflux RND transporter periplasmic adaptor subunit [Thermaerobacter sp.]|nr:efflux RND transporter periplasmic adaptor subunit [Thermaerobacter sp.]